jgi:hypothetical protein
MELPTSQQQVNLHLENIPNTPRAQSTVSTPDCNTNVPKTTDALLDIISVLWISA